MKRIILFISIIILPGLGYSDFLSRDGCFIEFIGGHYEQHYLIDIKKAQAIVVKSEKIQFHYSNEALDVVATLEQRKDMVRAFKACNR